MCGGEECAGELLQFPLATVVCDDCVGDNDAGERSRMRVQDGDKVLDDSDELCGGRRGGMAAGEGF